jgi:hypothetical protein
LPLVFASATPSARRSAKRVAPGVEVVVHAEVPPLGL